MNSPSSFASEHIASGATRCIRRAGLAKLRARTDGQMRKAETVGHVERVGAVDPNAIITEPRLWRGSCSIRRGHQHRGTRRGGCPFRQPPRHDIGGSAGLARCG